ncbi:DUF6054 family protein [Clostridium thermobutyricum]|uniref:Uncharacterized protein n=1 Tax=Clostridium thermobutyricum DSM 4928 TaxID=1121339 RepID=A0A1V4SMG5_9CLOT|nr:DUF6054 family protein [Clostridium thermobutyricum]OPX44676.1 hypothetical protein CLTHE_32000 [Clostridium thermobutyricum DSM 4928]
MSGDNFNVNLDLREVVELLDKGIVSGSFTGERIDYHAVKVDEVHAMVVIVYEKHFYRAGNRLTLTVCINNINDITHVHCIGAGGGQGLFRFDWGASDTFTSAPREILKKYIIK